MIRQIKDYYKAKELELNFVKVKGHSKDKWNDKADILAKEDLSLTKVIQVIDINKDKLKLKALPK